MKAPPVVKSKMYHLQHMSTARAEELSRRLRGLQGVREAVVLPELERSQVPGMFAGLLITIGALTYVPFAPNDVWSPFTVLPIQIFNWVSRPQPEFKVNAAAAILVLLVLLLTMNAVAVVVRDRFQRRGRA